MRSASWAHVMQALAKEISPYVIDLRANTGFRDGKRSAFAVGQALANRFVTAGREGARCHGLFERTTTGNQDGCNGGNKNRA